MLWLLACAALACGGDGSEAPLSDGANAQGGTGGDQGPDDVAAQGGTGAERRPARAPACTTGSVPFIPLSVRRVATYGEAQRVRFIERGFGLPLGIEELPSGASSPSELGWLRVADVEGSADSGADVAIADAGAPARPSTIILGPRELGELPVSSDDPLELTVEGPGTVFNQHSRVVLRSEERVLVFHQSTSKDLFGTFSGFTLEGGEPLCATPFPTAEYRCADIYRNLLEVTVPGGANATLMPGQVQTVGDYRVLHGTTTRNERFPPRNAGDTGCADLNDGAVQVTAVLRAGEQ